MILLALALLFVLVFWYSRLRSISRVPLPPGPPGDPIIGHLRLVPPEYQEVVFQKWSKVYGDVMYLRLFNQPIIVLSSVKAAVDLLEKRSANYSDRPPFTLFKLMGWNLTLTMLHYGKDFQRHRRLLQDHLNTSKCVDYQPIQAREARLLLRNLVSDDRRRDEYLRRYSTSIIMRVAYGHQVTSDDDPYLKIAEEVSHGLSNAGSPGGTTVDFFPFLQHLPSWFPGTYYANFARSYKPATDSLHNYPFNEVQRLMSEGKAKPSFLSHHLERLNNEGDGGWASVDDIKGAAAVMYSGGAETTWAALSHFFLAMILHPECQAKAQEEIDSFVGPDRLPEFHDRSSLPYVEGILQETLRWNLTAPLGVPHRAVNDDIYEGMFIPKGALIIANAKAMTSDERVYANSEDFDPTRYLPNPQGRGEPHPNGPFGFGRRICPGRHLADANLWIAIASILATLTISNATDGRGDKVTPTLEFTAGISSHPKPFECRIKPRSARAKELISQTETWDF